MKKVVCGILGLGAGVCVQAGVWQLQRKRWKEELVASREKIMQFEAVKIESKPYPWTTSPDQDWEYRRVLLRGKFLHSKEMHMMRAQADQKGYKLYTPIVLADGSALIVNRGWVPEEMKSWRKRNEGSEVVTVEGVLRASDYQGQFTPENDSRLDEWNFASIPEMASNIGLTDPDALHFYVQSVDFQTRMKYGFDEKLREPVPAKPGDLMNWWATPETHASYAAFWFSSSFVCLWFLIRTLRLK